MEKSEIPRIVSGAGNVADAMRRFKMDKESFVTPLVSFWFLFREADWVGKRESC